MAQMAQAQSNRNWIRRRQGDTCVIFVHGILSSGEVCWTHGNGTYWPVLLAQEKELEDVGILVFSYRSDVFCHNYNLGDVVRSLREILDLEELLDSKRIIFVCHSMGGIVVRRFLVKEQAHLIPRRIEFGVFLIASPSLGSRDANTLSMFARVVENSHAEVLRFSQSNQWLNDLDNDFMDLKEDEILKIKVKELVEDEPIKIKKWLGFRTQLVEPFSAARYFARPLKIEWSDHKSIAKPANERAMQHEVLTKFIKEMLHPKQGVVPEGIRQEEINQAIQLFQELEKKLAVLKEEKHYSALTKVANALRLTGLYLRRRRDGGKRDVETEHELSDLWEEAGHAILPFDSKLADLCAVKGSAWADEIVWSNPNYKRLPIRVKGVLEKLINSLEKQRERTAFKIDVAQAHPAVTNLQSQKSSLHINVYDGTRQPLASGDNILYRIIDGNHKEVFAQFKKASSLTFKLPFYDNFGDNYTVIVHADRHRQVGFFPLTLSPAVPVKIDLMLTPKDGRFNFSMATWDFIKTKLPFLASGVSDAAGKSRYQDLMGEKPKTLAALLNITTAMNQILLPQGTPLNYFKRIKWDESFSQDRFFGYCDPQLLAQIRIAAAQGLFAPVMNPGFFHHGATAGWKEIQFGEANVQLTFHEDEKATIDGLSCIVVESDIDYYKNLGAHSLLEVIPNSLTGVLTNPQDVYVLRWIAGRHAGVPEFNPPYTIVN